MSDVLKLVLTDHWFEEIKAGRKTHEYREFKPFWENRLSKFEFSAGCVVEFQKEKKTRAAHDRKTAANCIPPR